MDREVQNFKLYNFGLIATLLNLIVVSYVYTKYTQLNLGTFVGSDDQTLIIIWVQSICSES